MASVLIIEDDTETAGEIVASLLEHGFAVAHAPDGLTGLERARTGTWDAPVVDRMLPGIDGLTVIRRLREAGVATPALVLSALDQVNERITGLRAGGDDYLVKPFAIGELVVRLEVLIRRPLTGPATLLRVGPVSIDMIARKASRGARPLDLLAREFQLLEYLMRHAGQVVTRKMLLEDVFGYRFELKSNLVDVHMGRLRRKLDLPDEPPLLHTVRGAGFVLRAPD
jgi:two-component system OmpR family response regulator